MQYRNYVNSILAGRHFEADDGTQAGNNSQNQTEEDTADTGEDTTNDDAEHTADDKANEKASKTFTEAEVQAIVQDRLDRERNKAKAEQEEAEKLKNMSNSDKTQYQIDKLQKELAEAKALNARNDMTKVARAELEDTGVVLTDEDLAFVVTDEAVSTKANVAQMADLIKRVREAERQKYLGGHTLSLPGQKETNPGVVAAKACNEENHEVKKRLMNVFWVHAIRLLSEMNYTPSSASLASAGGAFLICIKTRKGVENNTLKGYYINWKEERYGKAKKKTPDDDLKVRTAKYVALGAWSISATQLIDLIKFIIKRLT